MSNEFRSSIQALYVQMNKIVTRTSDVYLMIEMTENLRDMCELVSTTFKAHISLILCAPFIFNVVGCKLVFIFRGK